MTSRPQFIQLLKDLGVWTPQRFQWESMLLFLTPDQLRRYLPNPPQCECTAYHYSATCPIPQHARVQQAADRRENSMKHFFTITDANTQHTNSRSQRFAGWSSAAKAAINRTVERIRNGVNNPTPVIIMESVGVVHGSGSSPDNLQCTVEQLEPRESKCLVMGCTNHRGEGKFIGDLCAPCDHMLRTGRITQTSSFLGELNAMGLELGSIQSAIAEELELPMTLTESEHIRMAVRQVVAARDDLSLWKESALRVDATWNPQRIATKLGMTVGTDIRANLEAYIDQLIAKTKQARLWTVGVRDLVVFAFKSPRAWLDFGDGERIDMDGSWKWLLDTFAKHHNDQVQ